MRPRSWWSCEQPEPVGVLDDHHRRVRHVDADLDHGGRDEHVELAGRGTPRIDRLLVGRRHLPVQQAEPQAGELLGARAARTPRSRPSPRPSVEPSTSGHTTYAWRPAATSARTRSYTPVPLERARADDLRDDRRAPRRQLAQLGLVEVAVDQHRGGARDRRRGHHEHVGLGAPLPPEQVALLDAEAVLLVDDGERRGARTRRPRRSARACRRRCRRAPSRRPVGDPAALGGAGAVREQLDPHRPLAEQRPVVRHGRARRAARAS